MKHLKNYNILSQHILRKILVCLTLVLRTSDPILTKTYVHSHEQLLLLFEILYFKTSVKMFEENVISGKYRFSVLMSFLLIKWDFKIG